MSEGSTEGPDAVARLERALARLEAATREAQAASDDDPVFVCGLGWRSGSTLVQRALMTDPRLLVWGEPMDIVFYLERLTQPLLAVDEDWPAPDHWLSHRGRVDLTRDWVATLSPDPGWLKAGYRGFFDQWLAAPARARGFARWGFKEVRCSGAHALVLRWLYPRCALILVARHPVMAYASLRNAGFDPATGGGVVRWPDWWITSAESFARLWNDLALSWWEVRDRLDVRWFRYEDLVQGQVNLDAIGASIGLKLKSSEAFGSFAGKGTLNVTVSTAERDLINDLTAEGRALFAYAE